MDKLSSLRLSSDYEVIKSAAFTYFQEGDFDKSLRAVIACSRIAYEYSFLDSFCDDDLEALIEKIGQILLPTIENFDTEENKIVFYDYFAWDNRGLTQQYLTALIELKFEILYIVPNDIFRAESTAILNQLKNYDKASVYVFSENLSLSERIARINSLVSDFKPSKAFLHLAPWDVIAVTVFSQYKGFVKRFFINLTDHAFWLGKSLIDVNLEFRSFGFHLSNLQRKIHIDKLVILPYYPIITIDSPSHDLDFSLKDKVVGISGGSGYKFLDEDNTFYNLIKRLIRENENFVFILVGASSAKFVFEELSTKDGIKDRFIFLKDTPGIHQLIKKCDIYFNSFPVVGGLMTQIAALAEKPIVTYNKPYYQFNTVNDLLPFAHGDFQAITDQEEFIRVVSQLINSQETREQHSHFVKDSVIKTEDFRNALRHIMDGKKPFNYLLKEMDRVEDTSLYMSEIFIERENKHSKAYTGLLDTLLDDLRDQPEIDEILKPQTMLDRGKQHMNRQILKKLSSKLRGRLGSLRIFNDSKTLTSRNTHARKIVVLPFKGRPTAISICGNYILMNTQYISIGESFSALYNLRIEAWDSYGGLRFHPEIVIGNNVVVHSDVHIGCINKVSIGNNVLMASRVYISDHSHGEITKEALRTSPIERNLVSKGPVVIEDNVWVGEGVCIMPGITIGANSILGANSVITKDVPPYTVVAGNPAKVIRNLQ